MVPSARDLEVVVFIANRNPHDRAKLNLPKLVPGDLAKPPLSDSPHVCLFCPRCPVTSKVRRRTPVHRGSDLGSVCEDLPVHRDALVLPDHSGEEAGHSAACSVTSGVPWDDIESEPSPGQRPGAPLAFPLSSISPRYPTVERAIMARATHARKGEGCDGGEGGGAGGWPHSPSPRTSMEDNVGLAEAPSQSHCCGISEQGDGGEGAMHSSIGGTSMCSSQHTPREAAATPEEKDATRKEDATAPPRHVVTHPTSPCAFPRRMHLAHGASCPGPATELWLFEPGR